MDYESQLHRQWEINAFHNLGFLCNGYTIEETNHGYENETRDATSIEIDFWERMSQLTPEIPVIQISDEIDLYGCTSDIPFDEFEERALERRSMWLENKYEKALCSRTRYRGWSVDYRYFKVIRPIITKEKE